MTTLHLKSYCLTEFSFNPIPTHHNHGVYNCQNYRCATWFHTVGFHLSFPIRCYLEGKSSIFIAKSERENSVPKSTVRIYSRKVCLFVLWCYKCEINICILIRLLHCLDFHMQYTEPVKVKVVFYTLQKSKISAKRCLMRPQLRF